MDFLQSFLSELRTNGYEPIGDLRINSSTWERIKFNGEKSSNSSGGYKLTQNPDGSLFGSYGSSKDKLGFRSWRSDSRQELTWQEIAAQKTARESHRRFLDDSERKRHERIGARLAKVLARAELAFDHPYLDDKCVDAHGIRLRRKGNELLIPRYALDGKIYGMQRITQREHGVKSWKGYFKGALGKGLFYPLYGHDEDMSVILLAEGFSTSATVRECTELPTVCCFDAGNLRAVAVAFRKKYPSARLIFCGDNDQWPNAKGIVSNTGVLKAQDAAAAIGGAHVIFPEFHPEHHAKFPTDWNDAMLLYGRAHVKERIMAALEVSAPEIPLAVVLPTGEAPAGGFGDPAEAPDVQPTGGEAKTGDMGMNFRVLGYNGHTYYYYPYAMKQIVELTASSHSINNLVMLDNLDAWEAKYRDHDGKLMARHPTIALYAWNALKSLADKKGIFQEEKCVRGAGAWIDEGRVILNCGNKIYVDGAPAKFESLASEFIYVASSMVMKPAPESLTNSDARRLRTICESLSWENKLSGTLLAGWLVIAPICAALTYRPHIYITGESDSGKSTVMEKIIKPVLGKMALCVDGGTTEPKIRQSMGYAARPLVYDEAEPSPAMIGVIELARKASTGSTVGKFGQKLFKAQFCACFSAINPPVNKTADENRISFMHLKKNRRLTAAKEYDDLCAQLDELITPDFSERLLARTLDNMNTLIANIRIFQAATRKTIGGARASQQVGTMMAGVYLLGSTAIVTDEAALEIVSRFSWTDHTIIDQDSDPIRLVQWLAGSMIKSKGTEETVGELIIKASIEQDIVADKILRSHGIAVKGQMVDIASRSQNLGKMLNGTEWQEKWSRTLSDVPDSSKKRIAYFSPGIKTSAISIPIKLFVDREGIEDETPVWDL